MKRTIMSYMVATIVSFAAIGALALQPLPIMAQTAKETTTGVACGEVVSGTVNLTSNLVCSGDGLIVGKDKTIVNLNGHSLVGPGTGSSKVGFMIPNTDDVTIQGPGTVESLPGWIASNRVQ